ncbi:C-type lectin domain family 12 member B-like isoform X1 [Gambusia affinis]|uniref:C-type lectin domain family 12 member B-like isoform X1 n=1 Tax=Gambusia affinis TaxID=33528 RepID=UPI001CDD70CE|nr:C-type lectin domain family 12 member B-like isoform X1 [Gambusia affinis]
MADNNVQYASVVFKNKRPARAKKEEEVVYDDVKPTQAARKTTVTEAKEMEEVLYSEMKKPNKSSLQTSDTNGPSSDKEAKRCCLYQKLVYCFGSLCVILVVAIIGVSVYFVSLDKRDKPELKQPKDKQIFLPDEIYNMTNLNNKFNIQVQNLTQQQHNLTAEISQVQKNHDLQTKMKTLGEEIKTCKKQKLNQTLHIIDEYCPKENGSVRRCSSCPKGWIHSQSSCYAVNNPEPKKQKTWEEAREDCKGKSSDLTVIGNQEEKTFVDDSSWKDNEGKMKGFWIGLSVEGGKWKWMDGNDLTNQAWIQQPDTDGQCVTSLQKREWKSVNCTERNGWICEKKALSV